MMFGEDSCPYCAFERWGVVVALSRFGTFSDLHVTTHPAATTSPTPRPSPSTAPPTPAPTSTSRGSRSPTVTANRCRRRPRRRRSCSPAMTRPPTSRNPAIRCPSSTSAAATWRAAIHPSTTRWTVSRSRLPPSSSGAHGPADREVPRRHLQLPIQGDPRRRQLPDRRPLRAHRQPARLGLRQLHDHRAGEQARLTGTTRRRPPSPAAHAPRRVR